ncbi:MAG: zinc ABC transporter substrate-binding protein [Bacteroidota bacterium]
MKKIALFLFFGAQLLSIRAQEGPPVVVATASMFFDMAKNIAGEHLPIQLIVPIGSDPHLHIPTPQDAKLVADADLILKNGLTFEGWLEELIKNSGTNAAVKTITEGIEAIASDEYANSTDPHAWMNARHGLVYIKNIKEALTQLVPEHAEDFEANYQRYKKELEELDRYIESEIQKIPESRRILITSHDAFQYYGRRYGIQLESTLGTSTDAEVQTSDIVRLNRIIRKNKVPAIFVESTINPKLMNQLAKDNRIKTGGQLYADSIGDEDSPASTYLAMLKYNTDTIVKALTAEVEEKTDQETAPPSSNRILLFGILGIAVLGGFAFIMRRLNQ